MIYLLSILFLFSFNSALFAQGPDKLWAKDFRGNGLSGFNIGYSVEATSDSGYIITGIKNGYSGDGVIQLGDIWLIKTNATGDTLWTKTFGDGFTQDEGRSVRQTFDGGYIIAGRCNGGGFFGYTSDAILIKTDATGDTIWAKRYDGGNDFDEATSVQQVSEGGYIFTGRTRSWDTGAEDLWLIRTDDNGDTLWTKTFKCAGRMGGNSVRQISDGGYIISGNSKSLGAGSSDLWLIRTDDSGDSLWTKAFAEAGNDAGSGDNSVQQTSDGGFIIVGKKLIKTDMNGDTLWTKPFGGNSVQQTIDGGYIIAGTELIKTNINGDILWAKSFGDSYFDIGRSVQQTSDGGFIVTGSTETESLERNISLIRFAPEITLIDVNTCLAGRDYHLLQNYPNPFNPTTTISYQLSQPGEVELSIYNLLGQKVAILVKERQQAGYYSTAWDASGYPSGVYIYQIKTNTGFNRSIKLLLLK